MEEVKVLDEAVETVAEQVNENTVDTAVEAGKAAIDVAKKLDIWSVIFIILLAIGLIASGGWIVWAIIKLVKFIKAKKAAAVEPKDNDTFVEAPQPDENVEKTE